jgi:hypothetical protein
MKTITYINRNNDRIKFTQVDKNTIKMEGGEYFRFALSNDYSHAFNEFCPENVDRIDLDEFIKRIHDYDYDINQYKYPNLIKFRTLIKSTNKVSMVDPSGGPCLLIGKDMKLFGLQGIISGFDTTKSDYIEITVDHA